MRLGQRFESARRLSQIGLGTGTLGIEATPGNRSQRTVALEKVAGSSAVGHPMIRTINVTMQRALRLDQPVW
jgi:precorrin-6B methylase 2